MWGFVSVTLVTSVIQFFSVSYLFLLFIGLFSKTCKCDILDGCLQPHGSCLSQCRGVLELVLGEAVLGDAVPPLGTAALAVF